MVDQVAEDEVDEEIERFDDFTIASSWERFISEIEAVCRAWLADGPHNLLAKGACPVDSASNLYKAEKELKYNSKSYSMDFYFREKHGGKAEVWDNTLHDLQLYFGVDEFLVITPQSASSFVHDSPEASKLLSAVAIALSNCSSSWPAFVLVHNLSRRAYIGIQNLGTAITRRFEADYLGSQVPAKLMHLEGLYALFVAKFAFSADNLVRDFKVKFCMRLVYRSLLNDENYTGDPGLGLQQKRQWDDDCSWSEWYSVADPVIAIEVITLWSEKTIGSSTEIAEVENFSPHQAKTWLLQPIFSETLNEGLKGSMVGFASRLSLLVNALQISFEAQFLEDYVSVGSVSDRKSLGTTPPSTVVDRILRELFHEGAGTQHSPRVDHKNSRAIKGAPLESLFAQLCLHVLWFGNCNIRAIATLWTAFVREVNGCWEESQTLPKMPLDGTIDLSTCLINQKLQMLAICIERKRDANQEFFDASANQSDMEEDALTEDLEQKKTYVEDNNNKIVRETRRKNLRKSKEPSRNADILRVHDEADPLEHVRRGSKGAYRTMMLLNSPHRMHAPFTQDPPLMTEDMHEERMRAVEASGGSFSFSAQLERDILMSDMSSFKAANPGAAFEDFIRWHSPGDWDSEVGSEEGNWPPLGRLSKRMSEQGNSWRKIWDDAPALPADEQKPLLDADQEGEKVLHYLETLRPHQLLEQMVCTAFRASGDTMNQTVHGDLEQARTKMDQLYVTMASTLRPLQVNQLSQESDAIGFVNRLCNLFQQVERVMYVAASLHRKFMRASRLSNLLFENFCNSYLGSTSSNTSNPDKSAKKIKVRRKERFEVEAQLFPIPTTSSMSSSSWRNVISMGNLMNGHDPVLREIIFSATGRDDDSAAVSLSDSDGEIIDKYRMYVRGSSDNLRVALSLVSCD